MRMRYAAYAAPFVLAAAVAATILLTSSSGPQPNSATPPTAPHSPRDAPATPAKPQPPDRCTTPSDSSCILAVYKGAPGQYAEVQDVPDSVLIQPDEDGRYKLKRGQQTTVVTVAPLPAGYTRFYLQRRPVPGPSPTSHKRLIQPVGTTYTFTPTTFEGVASLISFDLTAARPRPLPRPGQKPELGNVVATTTFQIVTPPATAPTDIASSSRRGVALAPGSHRFTVYGVGTDLPSLIIDIPTSEHQIKWLTTFISNAGIKLCLSDMSEQSVLCLDRGPRKSGSAALSIPPTELPR